jgi:hypothetical protein
MGTSLRMLFVMEHPQQEHLHVLVLLAIQILQNPLIKQLHVMTLLKETKKLTSMLTKYLMCIQQMLQQ